MSDNLIARASTIAASVSFNKYFKNPKAFFTTKFYKLSTFKIFYSMKKILKVESL